MHAFPSNDDMENLVNAVRIANRSALLPVAVFFAGFFRLANALRFFWFDAFYAFGITMLLPWLLKFV
jgi:L-asparaginase/Glu-tRNA(Gln) amidotransferase subunit D